MQRLLYLGNRAKKYEIISYIYETISYFFGGLGACTYLCIVIREHTDLTDFYPSYSYYIYIQMGKKVRISDESVNCYGTRIITSGIDLSQYEKNPVLLYMHDRSNGVVGLVKNIHVDGTELLGELEFDGATELSQRLKKQYEFGSMRMVSGNFQIIETSGDKDLVLDGQTAQTIIKCKLFEVSAVDIGGNDNAIVLTAPDGKAIPLAGQEGNASLPLLNNVNNNPLKKEEMELKALAIALGLKETATEAEVNAKISDLKLAGAKVASLETQVKNLQTQHEAEQKAQEQLQLAAINQAVETAIQEKRIAATVKDHFVELGKKVGLDTLKLTLQNIPAQQKLSGSFARSASGEFVQTAEYTKLSQVPADKIDELRDKHRDEYIKLFKAEYGLEPDFAEHH